MAGSSDTRRQAIFHELKAFALREDRTLDMRTGMTREERRMAHQLSEKFGFGHRSMGGVRDGVDGRFVRVTKEEEGEGEECGRELSEEEEASLAQVAQEARWTPPEERFVGALLEFARGCKKSLSFPTSLVSRERRAVHAVAERLGLDHETVGAEDEGARYITVFRVPRAVRLARRQQKRALLSVVHGGKSHPVASRTSEGCSTPPPAPRCLRVLEWNVRDMVELFVDGALRTDRATVERCTRIALVIRDMSAHMVCVTEAPLAAAHMRLFVEQYLSGDYCVLGTRSLMLLVLQSVYDSCDVHEDQDAAEFLRQPWFVDLRGDCTLEEYSFTRVPLVVRVGALVIVVTHLKSKYVKGGVDMWAKGQPEMLESVISASVRSRRRIAAECARLRVCLTRYLVPKGARVLLCGDLNTGPGAEFFSDVYLLPAPVDLLTGSQFYGTRILVPVIPEDKHAFSVIFDDYIEGWPGKHVLIDHAFVTPNCQAFVEGAGVAHDVYARFGAPSDHRPLYVDVRQSAFEQEE